LWLLSSETGEAWQGRRIRAAADKIVVSFDQSVLMRYLRIQASGRSVLSLREVEVYASQRPVGEETRPAIQMPENGKKD